MNAALECFASRFSPPGGFPDGASPFCIPALTGSADAFLAVTLAAAKNAGEPRLVLVVTPGIPEAERLADDLRILSAARVIEFPPLLDGDRASFGLRLKAAADIQAWLADPAPSIAVASYPALATPVPLGTGPVLLGTGPGVPEGTSRNGTAVYGDQISFSAILDLLNKFGYARLPQVVEEGDCSVRGGIVDFWSPGDEFPVRAEFFGDELESLRRFNPTSQTSIEKIGMCEILPVAAEVRTSPGDDETPDAGREPPPGVANGKTVFELLPANAIILALDHNSYSLASLLMQPPGRPASGSSAHPILYTGDPAPAGVPSYDFQTVPLPGFAELGADEAHHPELFDAARRRLQQHLDATERRGALVVRIDELSGGFELPGMVVVTRADRVFAKTKVRGRRTEIRGGGFGARLSDFDDLEPGEYVVHIDYGVGRYLGSSEIVVDGRRSEVFTIEYADGGKLHVPAAHAHLLSRYVGVKGEAVHLHRLDGKRWEKDKRDAQKAVSDLAASLLETQARREMVPGFAYDVACDGLEAFEAAFPYEETADQAAAIAAVKQDLAARRPMDRLICGDAGYGKTEVAMRAAFIAAMNGKQVAVLAPTTVLAEQHFETFTARFDGTPIRIESCSRFQTAGTHAGTFQRLATGACDIVIGTHAILSSKVCFRDLGLIVIDEEQRFGVRHKEFLKRLRTTADVLTLSATPIPRTLYLSMTGARDLSLLRSPPRERVAVDTRIVRDSDETIRAAVEGELARGGQVFFLHNRVMDIGRVEKRLRSILARPRIVVAHGQMDARTLAKKMRDFERGDYDILLSTTIIESGIDIPRANTILVDRADMFGMADLYQLRGRVGRSSRQGHAYFLLPPSGSVDAEARERLTALQRHGGLGAGFNLAVRDLELRGAGNLLGSQQSGHIAAIGFGLYCQLLKRTVAMMKGEKVRAVVDVKLNLDFANPRLPYEYIEEDAQRLSLMKRFAEAQDVRVVKALSAEMRDRFGPPPPEAREFVHIAELRVLCANAMIEHIDVRGARAVFYRSGSAEVFKVVDLKGGSAKEKLAELAKAVRG